MINLKQERKRDGKCVQCTPRKNPMAEVCWRTLTKNIAQSQLSTSSSDCDGKPGADLECFFKPKLKN